MAKTQFELEQAETLAAGMCELVVDGEHFLRVVKYGMARAEVSLDIMTADFKAMLVPQSGLKRRGKFGNAESIVAVFRRLAERGVEIRILHAGTPSGAALKELKKELPSGLVIRRCPRLHTKAVVIDARSMYLGSANLTGAGLGAKGEGKRNFEMGIWTEAPLMIERVMGEFNILWEGRRCKGCKRKDVCPVPLEEPAL
jgi:phosphatidylserine/phosphatidylglycerophosphate/cardiolipin synthase-like enzyme